MTTHTRPPRDAQLLANIAEPLNPERPPFYVRVSDTGHPDGWYWVPQGAKRARYLARNVFLAEQELLNLRLRDGSVAGS